MKNATKSLAYNLRYIRQKLNLTQEQAAAICKISLRLYQKLELEKGNPTLQTLSLISKAFEINISEIFLLNKIRITQSKECFIQKYKDVFINSRLPVGLRTTEGLVLWKNHAISKQLDQSHLGTIDLKSLYSKSFNTIFQFQLECERRDHFLPYLNAIPDINGVENVRRWYPTAILSDHEIHTDLVAIYSVDPREDTQKDYFQFCNLLLKCI